MEKIKYFDLYCEWTDLGHLPDCGLCYSLDRIEGKPKDKLFKLMKPPSKKRDLYWGYDEYNSSFESRLHSFTPLRQNIILLMACLNNEKL